MDNSVSLWVVLIASSITAITTGLGALPFLFVKDINERWLGIGNSIAAGLMLGASLGLLWEGAQLEGINQPVLRLALGVVLGVALIIIARRLLQGREDELHIGQLEEADALKMLLIVGVMTAHSFAEGIGVGVSYGSGEAFGSLITAAIAIHNIPEGLAISLVLIPRGTSVLRAAGWSVFSSLPQPLMAIPAFLFVLVFEPFLPVGLGLAAGAMFYMVFHELLPEALEEVSRGTVCAALSLSVVAMLAFQAAVS
ncbi:MAG: ZIP family metal transporter [Chloroflexota bacterium]